MSYQPIYSPVCISRLQPSAAERLEAIVKKVSVEKCVDPLRDNKNLSDNPHVSNTNFPDPASYTSQFRKSPKPRDLSLKATKALTPTADFPSPGYCNLARRGAVRTGSRTSTAAFPSPGLCDLRRRGAVRRTQAL